MVDIHILLKKTYEKPVIITKWYRERHKKSQLNGQFSELYAMSELMSLISDRMKNITNWG